MIDPKTIKVGDFIRLIYLGRTCYTVVNILGDREWFCLEPHMDSKEQSISNSVCRDAYALVHDYELVSKPEPSSKPVQNPSPYRFDLLPADAMLKIAECMAKGDIEHGRDNWKNIEASVHHGRAMGHMFEAKARDQSTREREDHYTHTALRAIFALQMAIEEGKVS